MPIDVVFHFTGLTLVHLATQADKSYMGMAYLLDACTSAKGEAVRPHSARLSFPLACLGKAQLGATDAVPDLRAVVDSAGHLLLELDLDQTDVTFETAGTGATAPAWNKDSDSPTKGWRDLDYVLDIGFLADARELLPDAATIAAATFKIDQGVVSGARPCNPENERAFWKVAGYPEGPPRKRAVAERILLNVQHTLEELALVVTPRDKKAEPARILLRDCDAFPTVPVAVYSLCKYERLTDMEDVKHYGQLLKDPKEIRVPVPTRPSGKDTVSSSHCPPSLLRT